MSFSRLGSSERSRSSQTSSDYRVRLPYKARWADGQFAIVAGLLTLLTGVCFGMQGISYFALGFIAFLVGTNVNEFLYHLNKAAQLPPTFTLLNRGYVLIRRWSRCRTAIIATRYHVGQRVETQTGCMSTVREICAFRGKIYYRLNGFDHDYRESELKGAL